LRPLRPLPSSTMDYIPITNKHLLVGKLVIEEAHAWAFKLFNWHGRPPLFVEGIRAHLLYSDAEKDKHFRDTGATSKAYTFNAARLAWMLHYDMERMREILCRWQNGDSSFELATELKRPFRMLFRTSNKLDVTLRNIKCPAIAETPDHRDPKISGEQKSFSNEDH